MQKDVNIRTVFAERTGFPWYGNDQCRVRGSFFDSEGNYYSGNAMAGYFAAAGTYAEFGALVARANGVFSVIGMKPGECWLATDLVRSLPLFYCRSGSDWVVSDHADHLLDGQQEIVVNEPARLEFRGTGYVTGNETLVGGIHQVQAGEVIRLGREAEHHFHHTYRTTPDRKIPYAHLQQRAGEQMERAFSRMVRSLEGRTAVVPLSGGFDSRLIAVMLKRNGYRKVVCFTYGRKGNVEAAISERVARTLGFPWHFVEYNQQLIAGFVGENEFEQYYPWASGLTSMFFLQEYFAVKYLKDHGIIPGDAVFIPGHSGDFLGGSQFAKHQLPEQHESLNALASRILEVKYDYDRYSKSECRLLLDRIREQLLQKRLSQQGEETAVSKGEETARSQGEETTLLQGEEGTALSQDEETTPSKGEETGLFHGEEMSWSVHEDWDLKEKLAKFNVNSSTTYTFFGYAFRLPYYDRELVNFFRDVPVSVKRDKSLYDDLLVNEYFIPEGVHFDAELQTSNRAYAIARFRARIKRFLPRKLLALRPQRADLLYYREITAQLRDDLVSRGGQPAVYGSRYNKMIIDWYLFKLDEKISTRF